MIIRWLGRKLLKITGIILGTFLLLLTAFHIWFVSRAKTLLEETVEKRSGGKVKLTVEKLRYNYFNRRMIIRDAVFVTTDSATASTSYRFAVKEINLQLRALRPLIMEDKLLIDSLRLLSPDIRVTKLRIAKDTSDSRVKEVSIPYELGKVYHSIQDALEVLKVTRFHIDDGSFTLVNRAQPNQVPLHIGNIRVQIDNLQVDSTKLTGNEKLLFSDNVVIHSNDQDILFPDARHRLAFSEFRINLDKQLVEFDSCTIAATRTDSSLSSFRVFFDTLRLTQIDFDTLYHSDVIKADSVHCLNPKFELVAETGRKKAGKTPVPKLENIVKQLTGNLLLGFVVVENADFNIRVTKDGDPSSYTFTQNSFEMQGLSIDQGAEKPIAVKRFDMAIRNYENFIKDSSYSIRFDSVLLRDDRITLSDFHFNKLDRGRILNTFRVPRFTLEGLSWDDLLFEKKLKARSAVMLSPEIDYTPSSNPQKRQNLFQSLGAVNEFMDLDQLMIENGRIDLKLKKGLHVKLENASLSVQSQSLLSSTRLAAIKNSLNALNFDKGLIEAGNTRLELENLRYTGESGKFSAGGIHLYDRGKNFDAQMKDILVDQLVVDERTGDVFAEGIIWDEGRFRLNNPDTTEAKISALPIIELRKVEGRNTSFYSYRNGTLINTNIGNVRLDVLEQRPGKKLIVQGLTAEGGPLQIKTRKSEISAGTYRFTDNSPSAVQQVTFRNDQNGSVTDITLPFLSFTPHMERLIGSEFVFENVQVSNPVIRISNQNNHAGPAGPRWTFPFLSVNEMKITRPEFHFYRQYGNGRVAIDWQAGRSQPADILVQGLYSSDKKSMRIRSLQTRLADFHMTTRQGKSFATGTGYADMQVSEISIQAPSADKTSEQSLVWKARLNQLDMRDFRFDSLGKNNGSLLIPAAALSNLDLGSDQVTSLKKLILSNTDFFIRNLNGTYRDTRNLVHWKNAGYERKTDVLTLDTFSYRPAVSRDSFLLSKKYQSDYIQAGSGPVRIGPVDLSALLNDSSLVLGKSDFKNAFFTDYKDKQLPFNPGIIKPLPVGLLKKIPFRVRVDTILFQNSSVIYTERNDKTGKTGVIPVTNMSVVLKNARNFDFTASDSLEIWATGNILDSMGTRLGVKQSYTDSAGGFTMTLRMKPGDLKVLNSALIPLSSIKVVSGHVDSLELRAVGREYLALGEMKMRYDDLRIQVLKDGTEGKKSFRTRMLTFLANNLVIRSKNRSRTGDVFFIRHRDRSAIHYLIQITFSGVASSTGIKNNKKQIRRYRKELKEKSLPPFDAN